jgi:hypothetical protein
VENSRFQKVRQLYGEISLENTLKLLIRCKILYASRFALLDIFEAIMRFEKYTLRLFDKIKEAW